MRPGAPRRPLVPLLYAAQFMVVLDLTIVSVALPSIRRELALAPGSAHWVVTAYAVAVGGFLIVGGRAADALGRRRMLVVGALVFTLASLASGLAPSGEALVASRAAQGLGAAFLSPAAHGLLVASVAAGAGRTRALARWGSVGSLGAVVGLAVGGGVVELLGWRALFLLNVPIGLALVVLARVALPESRSDRREQIDVVGAALATSSITAVAYAMSSGRVVGWDAPPTMVAFGLAAVTLLWFLVHERSSESPLVPLSVARDRRFRVAGPVGLVHGATVLGVLFLLTVYLQSARGLSALQSGLVLLVLRAPSIAWAALVARAVERLGAPSVLAAGSLLMTTGLTLLLRLPVDGSMAPSLLPALLALGLAIPCVFVAADAIALGGIDAGDAAVGSGIVSTCQWLGGALGLALVGAVSGNGAEGGADRPEALVADVHGGLAVCAALAALTVIVAAVSAVRGRRPVLAPAAG